MCLCVLVCVDFGEKFLLRVKNVKPMKNSIFLKEDKKKGKIKEEMGSEGREGGEERERNGEKEFVFYFSLRFFEIGS